MTVSPDPTSLDSTRCAVCGRPHSNPDFAATYVTMVCGSCDDRAVNAVGETPSWDDMADHGENPVFVDGIKCWRRYRFGGYVTMRDHWDAVNIERFYDIIHDGR